MTSSCERGITFAHLLSSDAYIAPFWRAPGGASICSEQWPRSVTATSSLDRRTDEAVQAAVRALSGVTILSIAHRLETLMEYDKVVVLDQGRVAEMGPPRELASRADGLFAALLRRQRGGETAQ